MVSAKPEHLKRSRNTDIPFSAPLVLPTARTASSGEYVSFSEGTGSPLCLNYCGENGWPFCIATTGGSTFGSGIRNSAFLGIEMRQNLDEHVIPPHFLVYKKEILCFWWNSRSRICFLEKDMGLHVFVCVRFPSSFFTRNGTLKEDNSGHWWTCSSWKAMYCLNLSLKTCNQELQSSKCVNRFLLAFWGIL